LVMSASRSDSTKEFTPLDYSAIASGRPAKLNVVPNEWETTIRPLLGSARQL